MCSWARPTPSPRCARDKAPQPWPRRGRPPKSAGVQFASAKGKPPAILEQYPALKLYNPKAWYDWLKFYVENRLGPRHPFNYYRSADRGVYPLVGMTGALLLEACLTVQPRFFDPNRGQNSPVVANVTSREAMGRGCYRAWG